MGPNAKLDMEKLKMAFAKAPTTIQGINRIVDNNVVSGIILLLKLPLKVAWHSNVVGIVADLLKADSLNVGEDKELDRIRAKFEFEKILRKKGIDPAVFYAELFRHDADHHRHLINQINDALTSNVPTMRSRP